MDECDVLLIIGTQLTTGLPSNMLGKALSNGATIIKMDTEVDLKDDKSAGMLHLKGKSGELLPRIVSELQSLQQEPTLPPLQKTLSELPQAPDASLPKPRTPEKLSGSPQQPLQGSPARAAVGSQTTFLA